MTDNGLQCSKCKDVKPEGAFYLSSVRRHRETGRSPGYCRSCQGAYYKAKGVGYFSQWNIPHAHQNRQWLNDLKDTLSCGGCGESAAIALDFHHRDPKDKRYDISKSLGARSMKSIKAEVAKCDVLCANCHRKHHAGTPVRDVWQDYMDALPCGGALQGA